MIGGREGGGSGKGGGVATAMPAGGMLSSDEIESLLADVETVIASIERSVDGVRGVRDDEDGVLSGVGIEELLDCAAREALSGEVEVEEVVGAGLVGGGVDSGLVADGVDSSVDDVAVAGVGGEVEVEDEVVGEGGDVEEEVVEAGISGGLGDDSAFRFSSIEELDVALSRVGVDDGEELGEVAGGDAGVGADVGCGEVGVDVESFSPPAFVDGEVEGEDSPLVGGLMGGEDEVVGGGVGVGVGGGGGVSAAVAADLGALGGGVRGVAGGGRSGGWFGGFAGVVGESVGPAWRSVSPVLRRVSCVVAERITIRDEGRRQTVSWVALLTLFMATLLWGMILFFRVPMEAAVVAGGGGVVAEGVVELDGGAG